MARRDVIAAVGLAFVVVAALLSTSQEGDPPPAPAEPENAAVVAAELCQRAVVQRARYDINAASLELELARDPTNPRWFAVAGRVELRDSTGQWVPHQFACVVGDGQLVEEILLFPGTG